MRQRQLIFLSLGLLVTCSLVSFAYNDCIGNDAAGYYIPMAEALGAGQYHFAFNPKIPPLVPTLTGVVLWLIPVTGFTAMKMVTALFILFGLIPVYRLCRRLTTAEQAGWACLLYAVCAQVIRFGITPQLTAAKFFLVLWLFDGCVSVYENSSIKNIISMSLSFALLALCRTEGIFYVPLCLVALWLPNTGKATTRVSTYIRSAVFSLLFLLICLLLWGPWLMYEYKTTGYAILDSRQIMILKKFQSGNELAVGNKNANSGNGSLEVEPQRSIYAQSFGEKLNETLDGFYLPYLPLVCLAFIRRFRRKQWDYFEIWTISAVLLHVTMMWGASATGGSPVLKRYIFPAALLLMPYSALGWITLKNELLDKVKSPGMKSVLGIVVLAIVVVAVGDGLKQVVDTLRGKYAIEKQMGLWIREHADELDSNVLPKDAPVDTINGQWTGRSLTIAAAFPQTACWARAQHIKIDRRKTKTMQELIDFCRTFGVDVLKVDKAVRNSTIDFNPAHPYLRSIKSPWSGSEIELYHCGSFTGSS